MSTPDYAAIAPLLEPVELSLREQVVEAGCKIKHVWFLETAVVSVVAATPAGRQAEVGLAGREGMVDIAPINGIDGSPMEAFAQVPGRAYRLPVPVLREALSVNEGLNTTLRLYAQSVIVQVSATALVNISHPLEQRLARWLLMTHDRIEGDDIPMTHQFLSLMLGVRRAGVTTTVHKLESAGVIRARRALVTVTDRVGLQEIARDAYGLAEVEYARLLGTDFRRIPQKSNGHDNQMSSARRA